MLYLVVSQLGFFWRNQQLFPGFLYTPVDRRQRSYNQPVDRLALTGRPVRSTGERDRLHLKSVLEIFFSHFKNQARTLGEKNTPKFTPLLKIIQIWSNFFRNHTKILQRNFIPLTFSSISSSSRVLLQIHSNPKFTRQVFDKLLQWRQGLDHHGAKERG